LGFLFFGGKNKDKTETEAELPSATAMADASDTVEDALPETVKNEAEKLQEENNQPAITEQTSEAEAEAIEQNTEQTAEATDQTAETAETGEQEAEPVIEFPAEQIMGNSVPVKPLVRSFSARNKLGAGSADDEDIMRSDKPIGKLSGEKEIDIPPVVILPEEEFPAEQAIPDILPTDVVDGVSDVEDVIMLNDEFNQDSAEQPAADDLEPADNIDGEVAVAEEPVDIMEKAEEPELVQEVELTEEISSPEQEQEIIPEQEIVPEQETTEIMPEQGQEIIPEQETTEIISEQETAPEQEIVPEQEMVPEQEQDILAGQPVAVAEDIAPLVEGVAEGEIIPEQEITPEQEIVPEQGQETAPEQEIIPEQEVVPEQEIMTEQGTAPEQGQETAPEQEIIPEQEPTAEQVIQTEQAIPVPEDTLIENAAPFAEDTVIEDAAAFAEDTAESEVQNETEFTAAAEMSPETMPNDTDDNAADNIPESIPEDSENEPVYNEETDNEKIDNERTDTADTLQSEGNGAAFVEINSDDENEWERKRKHKLKPSGAVIAKTANLVRPFPEVINTERASLKSRIAMFVDVDNLDISRDNLMELLSILQNKGEIIFAKLYGYDSECADKFGETVKQNALQTVGKMKYKTALMPTVDTRLILDAQEFAAKNVGVVDMIFVWCYPCDLSNFFSRIIDMGIATATIDNPAFDCDNKFVSQKIKLFSPFEVDDDDDNYSYSKAVNRKRIRSDKQEQPPPYMQPMNPYSMYQAPYQAAGFMSQQGDAATQGQMPMMSSSMMPFPMPFPMPVPIPVPVQSQQQQTPQIHDSSASAALAMQKQRTEFMAVQQEMEELRQQEVRAVKERAEREKQADIRRLQEQLAAEQEERLRLLQQQAAAARYVAAPAPVQYAAAPVSQPAVMPEPVSVSVYSAPAPTPAPVPTFAPAPAPVSSAVPEKKDDAPDPLFGAPPDLPKRDVPFKTAKPEEDEEEKKVNEAFYEKKSGFGFGSELDMEDNIESEGMSADDRLMMMEMLNDAGFDFKKEDGNAENDEKASKSYDDNLDDVGADE
jgi:hypothetical protein